MYKGYVSDNMTPEQRNALKAYIESDSGKVFLQLMLNREVALKAECWMKDSSTERQVQLVNQEYGIYWVRTLIQDLITPPKVPIHDQDGK